MGTEPGTARSRVLGQPGGTGLSCSPSPRWGPRSFPGHKEPLAARSAARWHLQHPRAAWLQRATDRAPYNNADVRCDRRDAGRCQIDIWGNFSKPDARSSSFTAHTAAPSLPTCLGGEDRRGLCCAARPSLQEPPQPGEGLDPWDVALARPFGALPATARLSWADLGTPPRASTSPSPSLGCVSVESRVFYLYVSGFI